MTDFRPASGQSIRAGEVVYRPATTDDIARLSALATDSFVAKFGHLYSVADLQSFLVDALSEAAIASDLANPLRMYRLAEADGMLVGFCKLSLACGFPDHARGEKVFEIKQLYTDPNLTGCGLGSALMDWAMDESLRRGADEVQLSVYAGNEGAKRFYRRYGFEKVADITFRVGNHVDPEYLFARLL